VRALTALHLLAPGTPMLFQGQELGAKTPFFYFADHAPELADLVRKGRLAFLSQFASMENSDAVQSVVADPAARASFDASKLDWDAIDAPMMQLHIDLLALRRDDPTFSAQSPRGIDGAILAPECFVLRFFGVEGGVAMPGHADDRLLIINLGRDLRLSPSPEPLLGLPRNKAWQSLWSSEDIRYSGQGMRPVDDDARGWMVTGQSAVVLHAVDRAASLEPRTRSHD
ncbi:MAG: DUF3459 domain-containing protein, partial [Clostridia bacterium]|nr:DUF3459 domain-containing protein [Deltaproteobacteria bacterium]